MRPTEISMGRLDQATRRGTVEAEQLQSAVTFYAGSQEELAPAIAV